MKYLYDGQKPFHIIETPRSQNPQNFSDEWYAHLEQMKNNTVDSNKYLPQQHRGFSNFVMVIGNHPPKPYPALSYDKYLVYKINENGALSRETSYNIRTQ